VPHDAAQGVASVGTVYDPAKAHNDLNFVDVHTNIRIHFYGNQVLLLNRNAKSLYMGEDHITLIMVLHENCKRFCIAYENGTKTTDIKTVDWFF